MFQVVSDMGHPFVRGSLCAEGLQVKTLVFYESSVILEFNLFYHRVAVQIIRFLHVVHSVVLCASCMYGKPE